MDGVSAKLAAAWAVLQEAVQARHDGVVEAKRSAGLETIVTRMRGRLVASAVWQWREWARARQQLQARARRVVGRVRQAGVASAYVGWAEYREQKRRARRIGARLQRLALRRAVWGWAEGASLVRGEREASAHEAVEQALREEMRCSREELGATVNRQSTGQHILGWWMGEGRGARALVRSLGP